MCDAGCCVQAKATVVATNVILVSNISKLKIKQVFFFFFILFAIVCPIISSTICLKPANWTPSFRFYYSNCRIDAFFYSRQSRQADKGSSRKYYFTRRPSRNYLLGNGWKIERNTRFFQEKPQREALLNYTAIEKKDASLFFSLLRQS